MMRVWLTVPLQIVRDNRCKPLQPGLKGLCQQQHNNTAVCVWFVLCVCCTVHLRVGAERKVTHPASSAYKCGSLLAQVLLALRLSQGHNNQQQLQSLLKHQNRSFVTCHPIQHGNPMGTLWCGEDQPWLQRGDEDSASWRSPGTQGHIVTQDVSFCAEQSCWLSSTMMNVCIFHPHAQIAAITSRSLERSKEFAKKHGIPKAYGSYEELANDPDIGELRAMSGLAAQAEKMACCCCCLMLSLEHLCPDRHCVPGSAAHRALASRAAVPWGWEECVVRETFRYELQTSERPCRRSQEEQCLPDGGKVEGIQPFM